MKVIVFAGGGTGGHIYPAIAVADEIKARYRDIEPVFIGTKSGLEAKVVPQAGYRIDYILASGLRGRGAGRKMVTMASMVVGVFQAMRILHKLKPIGVFGSGGFVSAASLIAASVMRFPIVIQEQNSVPGLTNRLLAGRARRVYLGFKMAERYFGKNVHVMFTGNPLRKMLEEADREDARGHFGLRGDMPVVLVFGGSRGAHSLNSAAVELFKVERSIQGIIQTGERDYDWVTGELSSCMDRVVVKRYLDKISLAYRAADLAVARAGALSVTELAFAGLPSILVPYPFAADDHQYHNARTLEEIGGAVIVADRELSQERLRKLVGELVRDREKLGRMREALSRVAVRDSTRRIVDDMEKLLGLGETAAQ